MHHAQELGLSQPMTTSEDMTDSTAQTADSRRWTLFAKRERDDRWRDRCCMCLFFPTWRDMGLALSSLLLMTFVGFWVVSDGVISYMRAIDHPGWMTLVRRTANAVVFQVEGFDKQNRRGLFDIVVLKKKFLWVRASYNQLERDGIVIPLETVSETIFDRDMRYTLEAATDIIAVGTASQEGTASREVARANRRARETAKLIKSTLDKKVPIWVLNLGQYRDRCENCEAMETNWQRPFILIATVRKDENLNLKEALRDAMRGRTKLPSIQRYSDFKFLRYH